MRDIVTKRPNEDLIICIAGCRPGADRVVYAQPMDPTTIKAPAQQDDSTGAQSQNQNAAGAGSPKAADAKQPEANGQPGAAPAAKTSGLKGDDKAAKLEPTSAAPQDAGPAAASSSDAKMAAPGMNPPQPTAPAAEQPK